jgi:16S rRNA (guanine(1405)-N(7))-methyltransferase
MADEDRLEEMIRQVCAGARYRELDPGLVRRLTILELAKGRSSKETVKAVRNKLHQVGGAYQEDGIAYDRWSAALELLPPTFSAPETQNFCRAMMRQHASTRERLGIVENFYQQTLAPLGPIHSVLDLACGLNPLCAPWMPLAPDAQYWACDVYQDMTTFLCRFFAHMQLKGGAEMCDLVQGCPQKPVQLVLLLKTIPCLEQVDKQVGARLLDNLPGEHALISFPARSLGGRSKGMVQNYEAHFETLTAGRNWRIQRFEFSSELAFLCSRS